MRARSARATLIAALLGVTLSAAADGEGTTESKTAASPHGDPTACNSCHTPGATPNQPGPALPIVATCRSCHPTADMHPVGMAPNHVPVPNGWPLEDGKVTCATCHAEPAHATVAGGAAYAELQAPWHRGGPYASVTRFCYACHESAGYERTNPHKPGTPGDSRDASCSACHTGAPAPGASLAASRLRAGSDKVCTGTCHDAAVHAGNAEHMGVEVDAGVAATLPGTMPLLDGKIACFTCHEVHATTALHPETSRRSLGEGLHARALAEDWAALASQNLVWPGEDDPHALLAAPASDGSLCRACHGDGP